MKKILIKIFIINFPQKKQDCVSVQKRFLSILEEHAPLKKKKLLRANHAPYVTKALKKCEKIIFRKIVF